MPIDPGLAMLVGSGLSFGSNFLGGGSDTVNNDTRFMNDFAWKQSLRNEQFQKDLATHGIRMRVADAEAAGIHPLAALGAAPAGGGSSSASFIGGGSGRPNRWGDALRGMGQDISRAASATMSREEKQAQLLAMDETIARTDLVRKQALEVEKRTRLLGNEGKPEPRTIQVVNEDGSISNLPNPALALADPVGHISRAGLNAGRFALRGLKRFKGHLDNIRKMPQNWADYHIGTWRSRRKK